jgi:16S rRNA (cytidine1402-2'-O)-methyltransferase
MTPRILEKLLRGNDIALVVESGTPSISDPGFYLVREAKKIAIPVVAIPGATALIAALVSTGFPTDKFVFDGFLSSGANTRRRQIEALKGMTRTIILYESPRRVKSTLELVFEILGDIRGAICREMTKIHEEIVIDSVSGLLRWVDTKKPLKGEITLLLNQKDFILESKTPLITEEKVTKMIQHALFKGMSMRKLSIEISERTGLSKKKIYELALQIKNELY